jgi:hypothetical protein
MAYLSGYMAEFIRNEKTIIIQLILSVYHHFKLYHNYYYYVIIIIFKNLQNISVELYFF